MYGFSWRKATPTNVFSVYTYTKNASSEGTLRCPESKIIDSIGMGEI